MHQQMTLDLAHKLGDTGMRRAASAADRRIPDFSRRVCEYCLTLLALEGPMSGETLVERARAAGFDAPRRPSLWAGIPNAGKTRHRPAV